MRAIPKEEEWDCHGLTGVVTAVGEHQDGQVLSYEVEFEHPMGGIFRRRLPEDDLAEPVEEMNEARFPPPQS